MVKSYTIHSHKGGTGKTMFTMNLATHLVLKGKRVAVVDLDLNAPSMQTYAPDRKELTINDLFLNGADPEDVFFDATYLIDENLPGRLYMGLADISGDVIAQMEKRNRDDLLKDLYILMGLTRNKLSSAPFNAEYILIDTPPGLSTLSINGVAATEQLILLLRIVNADIDGTKHFLKTVHKALRPDTHLVVNQVPKRFIEAGGIDKTSTLINNRIIEPVDRSNIYFDGIMELNDVLINNELDYAFKFLEDSNLKIVRPIHYLDENNPSFRENFSKIAEIIIGNN